MFNYRTLEPAVKSLSSQGHSPELATKREREGMTPPLKAHRRVPAHTPAGENAGQLANITS